jgi:hypothetical protein
MLVDADAKTVFDNTVRYIDASIGHFDTTSVASLTRDADVFNQLTQLYKRAGNKKEYE